MKNDLVEINWKSWSDKDDAKYLKICPNCNQRFELDVSPCLDLSCCGIEHSIGCACDEYLEETFDLERLISKYAKPEYVDFLLEQWRR